MADFSVVLAGEQTPYGSKTPYAGPTLAATPTRFRSAPNLHCPSRHVSGTLSHPSALAQALRAPRRTRPGPRPGRKCTWRCRRETFGNRLLWVTTRSSPRGFMSRARALMVCPVPLVCDFRTISRGQRHENVGSFADTWPGAVPIMGNDDGQFLFRNSETVPVFPYFWFVISRRSVEYAGACCDFNALALIETEPVLYALAPQSYRSIFAPFSIALFNICALARVLRPNT